MSEFDLALRVDAGTDISDVDPGEIIVTSDGVIRINTTNDVITNILSIPSLIGYIGTQGYGAQGDLGYTGTQGSTGAQGATGAQGVGPQGFTGPMGSGGVDGSTGSQGSTGAQGSTGSQGNTGHEGSIGATGQQGTSSGTGSQGGTGITGFGADTGSQGFTGVQGDMGAQGYTGIQGATGIQGDGAIFTRGDTGAQGGTGSTGVQGGSYMGSIGTRGDRGSTGIQGSAGWTGSKGATGTPARAGFTGSQGRTAATGSQGSQGFTGSRADTGSRGTQGKTGTQGVQGATGARGQKGYTGAVAATGSTGAQGSSGSQGARGFTGAQGEGASSGAQGSSGPRGVQGETGSTSFGGTTGAEASTGFIGSQGYTGSQGVQGDTGVQGFTGHSLPASTGAQGQTGSPGAQGSTGSQGRQGTTVQGDTGSQGFTGTDFPEGLTGANGDTGAQGIYTAYTASPLTTETPQLVGFSGGAFKHNSNLTATSTLLTVPTLSTSKLSAATVFTQAPSITPITYTTASNAGSNTIFMIRNSPSSYPITLGLPYVSAYFTGNTFTQVVAHPSGWLYLYSDSNFLYSTPSNYIYLMNPSATTLSNLPFSNPIYHMAVDPLGNIFVSSCNITRYTVNPSTGELTSNASIQSPFPGARVYATAGYVYAYLSGATSNVFRYPNLVSQKTAFSCYPGTLSYFSADPLDKTFYSTTTSCNIFSYTVSTGVTRQVKSNLSSVASTSAVDPYTNTIFNTLSSSTTIQATGLDGILSYSNSIASRQFPNQQTAPRSTVYNTVDSNIYICVGNCIQVINSNAICILSGTSNAGNLDGCNAQFNSPRALCVDKTGSNLYVADTGNSSVRKIAIAGISNLQLWLDGADPAGNGIVPANGVSIATWVDKSGKARNATATGTNTYVRSSLNGLPGIQLSGNTSNQTATRFFSSTVPVSTFLRGISMFIVFQASNGQNNPTFCSPISRATPGANAGFPGIRGSNLFVLNSPTSTDTVTYSNSLIPFSLINPMIYNVSINPTLTPVTIGTLSNGVSYTTAISSTSGTSAGVYNLATLDSTSSNIFIGRDGSNGYLNGIIYEVIVFNSFLSTGQRQQIEGYLACKWGLPLQRTHPYYGINPLLSPLTMQSATVSTPISGLSSPQGVVCDLSNLYIADTGNHVIKRYILATSNITTIAGSNGISGTLNATGSAARFNYPMYLSLTSNSSNLYIADSSNYTVRLLTMSNFTTRLYMGQPGITGFTYRNFAGPTPMTLNSNGVLYLTDTGNNAVVYADHPGILVSSNITVRAGVSLFYTIAIHPISPILYLVDKDTSTVFSYNLSNGVSTSLYSNSLIYDGYLEYFGTDTNSNTYMTLGGYGIHRNNVLIPGTDASVGNGFQPRSFCIDTPPTYMYFYNWGEIIKLTISNGTYKSIAGSYYAFGYADGIGSNALFDYVTGICIDTSGSNLYVCDANNYRIRKINLLTSNVTTVAGNSTNWDTSFTSTPIDGIGSSAVLTSYAYGITQGKSGVLYFLDTFYIGDESVDTRFYLRTLDPITLKVTSLCVLPVSDMRYGNVVLNSTETLLYYPNRSNISEHTLGYYTAVLAGSNAGYLNGIGSNAQFSAPQGLSFKQSNLIIADTSNLSIRTIDPSSNVTNYNLSIGTISSLQHLSASSNSFYTMANFLFGSTTYSSLITIPIDAYAPTTYTFSNLGSTTQIQNTTGRPVTISVAGQTVLNPLLPSTANASYIATLFNTGSGYKLI